ncbi:CbiQ family ECF transporter T component [Chitinilyticum litopenaei]|uniref:CbiQ family ECF transporter T component n=1 Tax=Chitinilyticum litopenaei TaxID=1121276 RepID=UPI00041A9DAB|nr:CbiQ family ECF transporter T component [Chitinilyticum litopenaei]
MHPAVLLTLWLWLAILLAGLERLPFYALAVALLLLVLCVCPRRFGLALRRMRWLLLAVLLIYGWSTPGWYLWSGWLAPTREGLHYGLVQLLRLVALVGSLQLLLLRLTREQLHGGLHVLLQPLRLIGVAHERLVVRLALAIQYTDDLLEQQFGFAELLRQLHAAEIVEPDAGVCLPLCTMQARDRWHLLVLVLLIAASLIFLGNQSWP